MQGDERCEELKLFLNRFERFTAEVQRRNEMVISINESLAMIEKKNIYIVNAW